MLIPALIDLRFNLNMSFKGINLELNFNGRLICGDDDGYLTKNVESLTIENCTITGKGVLVCFYIDTTQSTNLPKVSKSIFRIHKDTDLLEHEIMELSTELENLGLSINKLNENIM